MSRNRNDLLAQSCHPSGSFADLGNQIYNGLSNGVGRLVLLIHREHRSLHINFVSTAAYAAEVAEIVTNSSYYVYIPLSWVNGGELMLSDWPEKIHRTCPPF